jgi:hypothetical protein
MRSGLAQGLAVARQLDSAGLSRGVQEAFVHGMNAALLCSVGIAGIGLLLTLAFMPMRAAAGTALPAGPGMEGAGSGPNPLATGRIVTATAEQVE